MKIDFKTGDIHYGTEKIVDGTVDTAKGVSESFGTEKILTSFTFNSSTTFRSHITFPKPATKTVSLYQNRTVPPLYLGAEAAFILSCGIWLGWVLGWHRGYGSGRREERGNWLEVFNGSKKIPHEAAGKDR